MRSTLATASSVVRRPIRIAPSGRPSVEQFEKTWLCGPPMPDEDLETAELKERIEEGVERALESEGGAGPRWTLYLSLSTAIIAVFAAIASLESGANSNDAILEKNDAILSQSKASDQWAYF